MERLRHRARGVPRRGGRRRGRSGELRWWLPCSRCSGGKPRWRLPCSSLPYFGNRGSGTGSALACRAGILGHTCGTITEPCIAGPLRHASSGETLRFRAVDDLVGDSSLPGQVARVLDDFEEVFAPVARMEFVRLLLALAAVRCWKVHHLDVKSAFFNGELAEEVYV